MATIQQYNDLAKHLNETQKNPARDLTQRILGDLVKSIPKCEKLALLHEQNARLLDKISKLEEKMKQQRTVAEVNMVKLQIAELRSQSNEKYDEIKKAME